MRPHQQVMIAAPILSSPKHKISGTLIKPLASDELTWWVDVSGTVALFHIKDIYLIRTNTTL